MPHARAGAGAGAPHVTRLVHWAAAGDLARVTAALDRGADVDGGRGDGRTALHMAALRGHVDVVGLLLDRGANVNAHRRGDRSALALASAGGVGSLAVVRLLVARGADLDAQDAANGYTALMVACGCASDDVAVELARRGANVNLLDKGGWSALMIASNHGRVDAVRALLEAGADVRVRLHGSAATALALVRGQLALPMLSAAYSGYYTAIAGLLEEAGAA